MLGAIDIPGNHRSLIETWAFKNQIKQDKKTLSFSSQADGDLEGKQFPEVEPPASGWAGAEFAESLREQSCHICLLGEPD